MDATELRRLLSYDPETGVFTWRTTVNSRAKEGSRAGCDADGYRKIGFAGRQQYAHRLAWLYMTGEWPINFVDHINGNKADNRWCNLRQATLAENVRNSRPHKDGKTGLKGVCFDKAKQRYQAGIRVDGKFVFLGRFNCPTAAHFAYCRAAKTLHGQFARTK